MINENLMNPVPLHTSKNKWYDQRKTYHGAYVRPLAPVGRLLPMVLTMDNTTAITRNVGITVDASGVLEGSYTASGNIMGSLPLDYVSNQKTIRINTSTYKDAYTVTFINNATSYKVKKNNSEAISGDLLRSDNVTCDLYDASNVYKGTIKWVNALLGAAVTLTALLYPLGSDDSITVSSYTGYIERIPYNFATASRWANIIVPALTMTGMSVGIYYLKITFDSVSYYSEPFEWCGSGDGRNIISVTYHRSSPIITSKNYIPFSYGGQDLTMEMYLPTYEMKPPYKFDSEVDELDGWKFVNKQVSYHQERCEFLCTQYFAEAIRLLWHSNERMVAGVSVDYMEPPEIDWSDDNHVCDVTLLFQCDTIVQTNGEAADQVSASDGSSFNGSFNPSFG